ncbi:MAG: hypothetical protein RI564_00745 [Gracilimonas sp.]|nr:hypothetical protein [Gracilimonas sp.]
MKFFRTILVGVVLVTCSAITSYAQVEETSINNSGSFYSLFGIGFPTDHNTSRELGMGIVGVSLGGIQSNSLQNPALWGSNAFTTISTGFNLSQFQTSNGTSENVNSLLEPGYFQATVPLLKEKLAFSASMYSVTRSNYRFVTFDSSATTQNNTVEFGTDIRGTGGINKLELGLGWKISKNLSIGYAPSLAFISQSSSKDVFFSEAGFGNNSINSKITGTAFGHRLGALFTMRKVLSSKDRISIGATANLPINIDANKETTATKFVDGRDQEIQLNDGESGEIRLPMEAKAGFTYYPSNFVNFSVEGLYEQWSDYNSDFTLTGNNADMQDRLKVGFGGEYHPYRTNSGAFLSNFRYSGGVSYDSGHLEIEGEKINTLWFSAGLGIISPRSSSTVDFGIRYGLRGTTNQDLIREKIWTFNISVNLSELMFIRRRFQ